MRTVECYHTPNASYYNTNPWTRGMEIISGDNLLLFGVSVMAAQTGVPSNLQGVVWRVSDQSNVATSPLLEKGTINANYWFYVPFGKPVLLQAGELYRVGIRSSIVVPSVYNATNPSHPHLSTGSPVFTVQFTGAVTNNAGPVTQYPADLTNDRSIQLRLNAIEFGSKTLGYQVPQITRGLSSPGFANYTFTTQYSVDKPVNLKSIIVRKDHQYNQSVDVTGVVYDVATQTLVASSTTLPASAATQGDKPMVLTFDPPVPLTPGANYRIGHRGEAGQYPVTTSIPSGTSFVLQPTVTDTVTLTHTASGSFYSTTAGGSYPTSVSSNNPTHELIFELPNVAPTAPTNVATTGSPPLLNWTHNDPDSDPQVKYQLRWRAVDN